MVNADDIGKIVVVKNYQGGVVGRGTMVCYTDKPTCSVNTVDGSQIHWHAETVEEITDKDELLRMLLEVFNKI